jgi:predicted amidohydrolase YtcJ
MTSTTLLTNGRMFTVDPAQPWATALLIEDDRIAAVGDDADFSDLRHSVTEWIDLGGRGVVPGLVDAHVHFQHYALSLQRVNLDAAPTRAAAVAEVARFAASVSAGAGWVQGRGWSQDTWPDRAFPSAADLDAILPDRPVCLSHRSGHAAWINTVALQRAHISAATPDPPGGQIQRDAAGNPTGILFEDAIELVTSHIPRPSHDDTVTAMRQAQTMCWQAGLTGLHDFDGRACFLALQSLREAGELGLRVVKNIPVPRLAAALEVGLRSGFGDAWLRIGGVKIFADGALGSRTAAMIAPYEGEPDNRGIVVTDKEEMLEKALAASRGGLSVTVHAIGDRANHDVLDVYAEVRRDESGRNAAPLRHRIEHVQVLHPSDLHRLADLGVIASMQPIHATADIDMADRYWGDRARYSYAWRTMQDSGALVVFGSDAPVESIRPLEGIHAAVTRRRPDGYPGPEGWYPEERLTLAETIRAFTLAAAETSGQAAELGSLTPGKLADLTIFDRDLFSLPPDELLSASVEGTIVGGAFRHRTF